MSPIPEDEYREFSKPLHDFTDPPLGWVAFRDDQTIDLPEVPDRHTTGPIPRTWLDFEETFLTIIKDYMEGVSIAPTNLYAIENEELGTMPMLTYSKIRVTPHRAPKVRLLSTADGVSSNLAGVHIRTHGIVHDYRLQFNCWGTSERDAEIVLQKLKDFFNGATDRLILEAGVRNCYWLEDLTDIEIVRYRLRYSVRSTQYMMTIAHGTASEVNEIAGININIMKPDPDSLVTG